MPHDPTPPTDSNPAEEIETETLTPEEYEEFTAAEPEAAPVSYSGTDFDVEAYLANPIPSCSNLRISRAGYL